MRTFVMSVSIVVLLLLAGCSAPSSNGQSHATPSMTPTPSASAASAERPSLVFGGDCSSALTAAEVSSAIGGAVTEKAFDPYPLVWSVQQLGGIWCRWQDSAGQDAVWATIIPTAAAGGQVADQDAGQPYCYGGDVAAGQQDSCSFGQILGDWWFAGVVYTAEGSKITGPTAVAAMARSLSPRLATQHASIPQRDPKTWSASLDCDSVATQADLASVFADPSLQGGNGNGPAEVGPGVYGAMAAVGYRTCMWDDGSQTGSNAFSIEVVPGAGWVLDDGEVGGAVAAVPGAESARIAPVIGTTVSYLYVTDGTNLLKLEPNTNEVASHLVPAVQPLLEALSS